MIDAHHHLWRIGEHGCSWPTSDLGAIYRDFELEEFEMLARSHGIEGSVLVQSQPDDADTRYLLRLAQASDFILGVCGWCALDAPDAPAQVESLAREPKLRSLRPMLQDLGEKWIVEAPVGDAISAMIREKIAFDALVRPRHLAPLIDFKKRHEDLVLILDHAGKPQIGGRKDESWRAMTAELAALPNTYCKLSGLLTEAPKGAGADVIEPYVNHLLECFSPKRVMWGSDWPVLNLAGEYKSWLHMAVALCGRLAPEERERVFDGTARLAYCLPERS